MPADGMGGGSDADVRAILAKIEEHTRYLAKWEQRRVRDLLPKNGSNLNAGPLQPGANGQEVINWPSGGGDDECTPILETVTVDIDWTFQNPFATGDGEGLDTVEGATIDVYWGSVSHRATFDLMAGFSVTVSGYKVLVKASYAVAGSVLVDNELVPIPQPIIYLRASLSPGTKHYGGIVGNARRTIDLGTIQPGQPGPRIEIPAWAKEIGIINTDITVPTMTVDQFANPSNLAVSRFTASAGKGAAETIMRESYSSYLDVTNTSENAVATKVVFYLGR